MCGIVYGISFNGKPINGKIMERYVDQRHRGSDGFGYFLPDSNRLTHNPREGRIFYLLRRERKAREILFHHRYPTSTANVRNACHPFSTKDYFKHNYVLVHNGVLYNEHNLKSEHERLGIDYISEQTDGSFNDSEALAFDVARYLEGETTEIKAQGSIAFICVKRDRKTGKKVALYFGRNSGNPLVMKRTGKQLILSSEGEGELIDTDTLYCFNYETGLITKSFCKIPTAQRYYSNPNYGNYMGYGAGYDWQTERDLDDIKEYNAQFGFDEYGNRISPTPDETEAYFSGEYDHDTAEKSYIKWTKEKLMEQAYESKDYAIELGQSKLDGMNKKHKTLIEKVEVYDEFTDDEYTDYNRIATNMFYLEKAIEQLRQEVSGLSQMGFQYTTGKTGNDRTTEGDTPTVPKPHDGFFEYLSRV